MSASPCVLLISPGILKWTDMDFGLPHLVALGGWLREKTGVRVEILDLNYEGGDHNDLLRTIDGLGPHLLIGLSTYSSFDVPRVMALARFLKDHYPQTPLVTGGYHASALPDDLVLFGEVGLAGEVRGVRHAETRLREAAKLGFARAIVPEATARQIRPPEGLTVTGVRSVPELFADLWGGEWSSRTAAADRGPGVRRSRPAGVGRARRC